MAIAGSYIRSGCTVIDATCGNGHDTLAMAKRLWPEQTNASAAGGAREANADAGAKAAEATGDAGRLVAFDLQDSAIHHTRQLLVDEGFGLQLDTGCIALIHDSHANMREYIQDDAASQPVCLVMFNLGYLPGGDKEITTGADTTLEAVRAALDVLSVDGLVCITMYSGHDAGAKEKQALLAFAEGLDPHTFHVAYVSMINQKNDPPEILLISRK